MRVKGIPTLRELNSKLERPEIKSQVTMTLSNPKLDEMTLVWLIYNTELPEEADLEYTDTVAQHKAEGDYDETTGLSHFHQ